MPNRLSRREFLASSAAAGAALPGLSSCLGVHSGSGRLRVLSIGTVGTIGKLDRTQVHKHPDAEVVGLCDVDSKFLAQAKKQLPKAFTCRDYREAFAAHSDKFDAVIVSTPDHSHASIMITALAHDKHVYGQKPLVQQLEELVLMERAIAKRPHLVTQLGNQRMVKPGRRAAIEILRQGQLGKAIAAYAWVGAPNRGRYFNFDKVLGKPIEPPSNLDWNLWLGPAAAAPYRPELAHTKWRSWWEYGTNGLGDWGCHLLDVIFFSYDELQTPIAVQTHCAEASDANFHAHPCQSVTTYAVDSDHFANKHYPIYYNDSGQKPSRAALGLPGDAWLEGNCTVFVNEGGIMVLGASGRCEIWRDGKKTEGLKMPNLPAFPKLNHWHAWVDNCLGKNTELRTPFKDAIRITEPPLLATKAARFPGVELRWDKSKLAFTNHEKATQTIVKRDYRDGFAPPTV